MQKALLLIDIQNDFCPGGALAVPEGDLVVPVANRLMPYFPVVIATRDFHPPGHISFASRHGQPLYTTIETEHGTQVLWPDHCIRDDDGAALHSSLDLSSISRIVDKGTDLEIDSYSAFFDNARVHKTNLDEILRELQAEEIYICGLATDYCVLFSALDGLELGYKVTIVTDGCRGVNLNPDDSIKALEKIVAAGGQYLTSDEVIKECGGEE